MRLTLSEIEAMAATGESETVELKKSTANLTRAAETLCGMLNAAGGFVLFGVTDAGEVVGQTVTDATLREVAAVLRELEPEAPVRIERVPIREGREVLALVATPMPGRGPWAYRGRAYRRVGPTTSPMSRSEYVRQLLTEGAGVTEWERLPALHHGIEDLDHQEILRSVRLGIEAGRLPEDTGSTLPDILDRFRLRQDGRLLNAAVVLFSASPLPDYPQCGIRLARFATTNKDEFIDNRQEQGHAFLLLEEAMAFFRRHLSISGRFHADRIERVDTPEYPVLALREAVVNALIHRSYVDAGGAVSVAIFADRLEIWSDGGLPFGQRPEDLKRAHTSRPRNPLIANVFFRRGLIEAWGRGTQKIIELCVAAGHPEPEFAVQAGAVVVTFRPRGARIEGPGFSPRQAAILRILAGGAPTPLRVIRAGLVDPPTDRMIQQDLAALRELGWVESSGRGRSAAYRMVKE